MNFVSKEPRNMFKRDFLKHSNFRVFRHYVISFLIFWDVRILYIQKTFLVKTIREEVKKKEYTGKIFPIPIPDEERKST